MEFIFTDVAASCIFSFDLGGKGECEISEEIRRAAPAWAELSG